MLQYWLDHTDTKTALNIYAYFNSQRLNTSENDLSEISRHLIYLPDWILGNVLGNAFKLPYRWQYTKINFDFKDLMTFGLFLLALLTFIFTFCK